MPTVTYRKAELRKLIGRKISDEELTEAITLIKPNLEKFDDETVTIEHTADRPDLFGVEGMARAVSSYLGFRKGLRKYAPSKPKVSIRSKPPSSRPYVSAMVVRKVDMKGGFFESMIEIQELLSDSIGRRRSKVAVGIHDLDSIEGPVSYSGADKSEKMVPLGGNEGMTLGEVLSGTEKGIEYGRILEGVRSFPAFRDSKGIFSFPPILNSERTKVTEGTRNLLVEVTGTDRKAVTQVMAILASNFGDRFSIESVSLKREKKTEVTPNMEEGVHEVGLSDANRVMGASLQSKEAIELLSRMGYDAVGSWDKLEVVAPAYRSDILHPVDVIEDLAIAYGYNNMAPEAPNVQTTGSQLGVERASRSASMSLVGFGFQEVMTSALSNKADQFERMSLPESDIVEIANPSSSEYTCVRKSLLPGLLKVLAANKHHEYPQNVFEVGDAVIPDKAEETGARNERRIAAAVCHSRAGFAEVKSVLDSTLKSLGTGCSFRECDSQMFVPGRGFDIYMDERFVGSVGELHPQVVQNWDIGMPTAVLELSIEQF